MLNKQDLKQEASQKLLSGINKIEEAVSSTFGLYGQTVIIDTIAGLPVITKDGVTVAKEVGSDCPVEQMAINILREAAVKTNEKEGDGTTTATILAKALYSKGLRLYEEGYSKREIISTFNEFTKQTVEAIKKNSIKVESYKDLENIATISANNYREVGKLVAETVHKVGEHGVIKVLESNRRNTDVELVKGYSIESGLSNMLFKSPEDKELEYKNCKILILDFPLDNFEVLGDGLKVLEELFTTKTPVVLICEKASTLVEKTLVTNSSINGTKIVLVAAPDFAERKVEILNDVAAMSGAKVFDISNKQELDFLSLEDFGEVEVATLDMEKTVFQAKEEYEDAIQNRVTQIEEKLKDENLIEMDKESYIHRIAKLKYGIATIRVGGDTKSEMKELTDRVEDAKNATQSALRGGIIKGGGSALATAFKSTLGLNTKLTQAYVDSLNMLTATNFINSGVKGVDEIVKYAEDSTKDFRLAVGIDSKKEEDFIAKGIIDPANVAITALTYANSVATTLLSTNCVLYNDSKKATDEDLPNFFG